jgi:hypothetical protein
MQNDYAWSVKQAPDSAYIIAGYTNSLGSGSSNFYIVKISNQNNALQWSNAFGGAGSDFILSMAQNPEGDLVLCGETDSYGAGSFDIYAAKLDLNGSFQWAKTYGGPANEYGESIIKTTGGGFAIAGYTNSFGSGDYDIYIL